MKIILSSKGYHHLARFSIFFITVGLIAGMVGCAGVIVKYDLTISSTEGGSVIEPGEDTFTYDEGTVVDLVAESDEGYQFVNWTGDVATIDDVDAATTTITMNGDYSITANFGEIPPPTFTIEWFDFQKQGPYALGEPVVVLMILWNEIDGPITVNQRFAVNEQAGVEAGLGEVFFIISDSANNSLPFLPLVDVFYPEAEDFTTLQPDELAAWGADLTLFYDLTSPGVYTVRAVYRSEIVPAGIEAWVGTLTSNTLTLTIE